MNTRELELAVRQMRAEIDRLKTEMSRRPVRSAGGSSILSVAVVGGGNTLSDGTTTGIKTVAVTPTTVPSIYDPDTSPDTIDGIGWATLYLNGVQQTKNVLLLNDQVSGFDFDLITGDSCATVGTVSIPLAGDATQSVVCYRVYFV